MDPKVIEDIPKKPMDAFFLYKKDKYEEIYEEIKEMIDSEATYQISVMWRKEDPIIKQKYQEIAKQLQDQYEKEMEAFEEKWGSIEFLKQRYRKAIKKEKLQIAKKKKEAEALGKNFPDEELNWDDDKDKETINMSFLYK